MRPLVVRKYERAGGPVPGVVARIVEAPGGSLGLGAERGDLIVLYSESLGDETRFRRLLARGRRARFRALVETPLLERTLPALREFGGHPL